MTKDHHVSMSQSLVGSGSWCQRGARWIHYIWQSLKETKLSRFITLWLCDRDRGHHPTDPSSYSTSSSKEYWLTSGDNVRPLWSFSSTLFLRFWSWSFSFWRACTCSTIFILSSAVLPWSCILFSDNSSSSKFRRVDIFKLSVFKAYGDRTHQRPPKTVTRNPDCT